MVCNGGDLILSLLTWTLTGLEGVMLVQSKPFALCLCLSEYVGRLVARIFHSPRTALLESLDWPRKSSGKGVSRYHRGEVFRTILSGALNSELIDPDTLCHVWVSPRQRAQKTFEILFSGLPQLPSHQITEKCREWDYGNYEGLKPAEIKEKDPHWSIWRDGSVHVNKRTP